MFNIGQLITETMRFAVITAAWLLAAITIGATGILVRLRPPAPQLILASLTIGLLLAWRLSSSFRGWIRTIDLRVLIAVHVTRFVGFYFLFLCGRGELPCSFAIPAGWGDIVVAIGATVLLVWWKLVTRRAWIATWNVFGLVDILFVVVSAARHGMADPLSMAAMLRLPLSLLLTFLVPVIIASHIFVFSRLSSVGEKANR
jgi:hypothetical protein